MKEEKTKEATVEDSGAELIDETGESSEPEPAQESGIVLAGEMLPPSLPILPVRPRPFFPGIHIPLQVGEHQLDVVNWTLESTHRTLGLLLVKSQDEEDTPENLHAVGVAAKILKAFKNEDGTAHILIGCLERFTAHDLKKTEIGISAEVEYHLATEMKGDEEIKAYTMAVITALKELMKTNPLHSEAIKLFLSHSSMLEDPGRLADFASSLTTADGQELQQILAEFDIRPRLDKTLVLLRKELELSRLQQKITKQIEERMSTQQREFFLREQLKAIKKELGLEKEGKAAEIEKFERRLRHLKFNDEALKAVEDEMQKLQILEPASPEYSVTHNYLDWLTILPWGKQSKDSFDLDRARKILDRDHYGLEDVKDRILEFIAVGRMKGDIAGSILCLVGPPGVGKTSVGMSIASAIRRKFYRFSLGGMRDEGEIKGHRRTYIGAMPGKFIQALKTAGTSNPVIMLDEIDKIGASFRGDPASALLEVLDSEQNSAFRDHYLDVPFDLSNVLFVTTANQLDTIPGPLLDRMEVIRLPGYILEEKVEIARRYLIPKALRRHGLSRSQLTIYKSALTTMIDRYAREAGVRSLEKLIRRIMRKAAMLFATASQNQKRVAVKKADLDEYLGKPVFTDEELLEGKAGIVTGLAWTSMGGATLQIEAAAVASKQKGFKQTGQLGNVMVESSEIAYSYVMANVVEFGGTRDFFDKRFIHLHVPAGATPKDGPSAGITMATALISMMIQRKVRKKLGMTGELTLTGRVPPIGGVKEKVIAARRVGLRTLIFPGANRNDADELPDYLRNGITFLFANEFSEVFHWAFKR